MITFNITFERKHFYMLAGLFVGLALLIPGAAWASHAFDDVPDSNVFHDDISWIKDAGITLGCGNGTNYCPEDDVTRGQMAAFMHRLSGSDNTTLDGRLDALEALLAGVSRDAYTLLLSGMNLQVVNGTGSTDGPPNGVGNVVIGYNELPPSTPAGYRSGSHNLVVGPQHSYTDDSYGGIVAGNLSTIDGHYASVTGGYGNEAHGDYASVSGGYGNTASHAYSSVTGGEKNTAAGGFDVVVGGDDVYCSAAGAIVCGEGTITASD